MNMERMEELIGKKVIAFSEAVELGFVLDLCFDETVKNFVGFLVCDKETESEMFLNIKDIEVIGECVFVENVALSPAFSYETNNPLGKLVYDKSGTLLGRVQDVILQGAKVDKLITDKCEIKPRFIYSSGRDYLIFSKEKKKEKINKFVRKVDLPKIEIMGVSTQSELVSIPTKISITPAMILNRTATADILGINNELIIKKGEIITQNKIEKAKKHNKLNNLIFNSK